MEGAFSELASCEGMFASTFLVSSLALIFLGIQAHIHLT
jgi:hypothetical protein